MDATIESRVIDFANTLLHTDDEYSQEFLPESWPSAYDLNGYKFIFWTEDGYPVLPDPGVTQIPIPENMYQTATKWYLPWGTGSGGVPGVTILAFSMANNKITPESPASSVTPASSMTGPNGVSTGAGPVTIVAKDSIGSEPFQYWHLALGGSVNGNPNLSLAQNAGGGGIAFFGQSKPNRFHRGPLRIPQAGLTFFVPLHSPDPGPERFVKVWNSLAQLQNRVAKLEKGER